MNAINSSMIRRAVSKYESYNLSGEPRRSILETAITLIDLTTLEGIDTSYSIRELCYNARFAGNRRNGSILSTAAVCVYPRLVQAAVEALSTFSNCSVSENLPVVRVAAVATSFPSGQVGSRKNKGKLVDPHRLTDVQEALTAGANEIDMVINRADFLSGHERSIVDDVREVKQLLKEGQKLKVILETGELGSLNKIRRASELAIEGGADFIKTSTGKISPGATMESTLVMLQTIRDHVDSTGKKVGMKPAGGIRTANQAIAYLHMVDEVLGPDWLTPDRFRLGASSLLRALRNELNNLQVETE